MFSVLRKAAAAAATLLPARLQALTWTHGSQPRGWVAAPLLGWVLGRSVHPRLPLERMCNSQGAMWPGASGQHFMFFGIHLWGHGSFPIRGHNSKDRDIVLGDCPSPTLSSHR